MSRPPFLKLPLIVLALVLASYVSGHAQAVRQETVRAEDEGGNKQEPQPVPAKAEATATAGNQQDQNLLPLIIPNSVICVLPGGKDTKPLEQRIQPAPGQNPLNDCPPGAATYVDYGASPGRFPSVSNLPMPLLPKNAGGGH
jgi:hypothetical protein